MTTKKLVPRASGEGAMGVDDNAWGEAYYDTGNFNKGLFVSGHNITQVIAETVTQGGLGGEWTRNGLDIYYNGGNVGIGTTSPSAKFEVKAPTMSLFRDINNVGLSNGIQFKFGDSASTAIAQSYASIGGVIKNNTAGSHNGELAFSTAKNGNLTIAEERMRIDSDGNVGIGTTSPSHPLTILSPTTPGTTTRCVKMYRGAGDLNQSLEMGYNGITVNRDDAILTNPQSNFSIKQKGSDGERTVMHIDTNGNVGIGATNPATSLEVRGPVNSQLRLSRDTSSATQYCEISGGGSLMLFKSVSSTPANAAHTVFSFVSDDGADVLERMRIDAAGNVGIGTTDPICDLDINGTLMFSTTPTSSEWMIENGSTTFNIKEKVVSSFTPRLTLLEGGNVGIGTTNPGAKLEVVSNKTIGDIAKIEISPSSSGNPAGLHITNTNADFDENAAYLKITNQAGSHILRVQKNGNVGIGTTNPNQGNLMLYADEAVAQVFACGGTDLDYRNWAINAGGTTKGALHFQVGDSVGDNPISSSKTKVTFDKEGNVGIGTLNPPAKLTVSTDNAPVGYAMMVSAGGGGAEDGGIYIAAGKTAPTSAGDCVYLGFHDGDGTSSGGVRCSSSPLAPEFFNGSDVRMKKNIEDCDINGIEKIKSLKLRKWDWNTEKDMSPTDLGLIADELEEVYPELVSRQKMDGWEHCVSEGEEGLKAIPSESKITLTLVKAIQEQQQLIEDLRSEVEALKNK